jgi:hypothetical protein
MSSVAIISNVIRLSLIATAGCVAVSAYASASPAIVVDPRVARDFGQLPLSFEPNRGQTDPRAAYLAHGNGYTLFLAPTSAVIELQRGAYDDFRHPPVAGGARRQLETAVIRMDLAGGNNGAHMLGQEPLPGTANYLLGNDRSKWSTGLPTFAKTSAANIYPGIDVVYYGTQGQLEYDFVVAPQADPSRIKLAFAGAHPRLAPTGDLVLSLASKSGQHDIRFKKPVIYQQVDGARQPVSGRFSIGAHQQVGFQVDAYDRTRELIIDPQLIYSSYLGGSTQQSVPYGMALNTAGDIYLTGITNAVDYPTTPGVIFPSCPAPMTGSTKCGPSSLSSAFVSKISADGRTLIYSTYLGGSGAGTGIGGVGSGADYGVGVAVDANDEAWILGGTNSNNFPITADAYLIYCTPSIIGFNFNTDQDYGEKSGCAGFNSGNEYIYGNTSVFIVKLNPTGTSILYGTFLGSSGGTYPGAIVLDGAGNVYVAGATNTGQVGPIATSGDYVFPTTASAFQIPVADTTNAFVTELSADGHSLLYSTMFGGATNSNTNYVSGLALNNGKIVIGGASDSPSMPTTPGAISTSCPPYTATQCYQPNAFVAEFDPTQSGAASLVFSTFLNGKSTGNGSQVYGVATDSSGNIYAVGNDNFPDFPTTAGVLQPTCFVHGGNSCNTYFVTKMTGAGAMVWSTFYGSPSGAMGLGANPLAITVDSSHNVYIAGSSQNGGDLPTNHTLSDYFSGSAFITELNSTGSQVLFGTFYGAANGGNIFVSAMALDPQNNLVFAGYTAGSNLPLVNALQSTDAGGFDEGFFGKISMQPAYSAGQLLMPLVDIGNVVYTNMLVTIGKVVSGPSGTSPIGTAVIYTPLNNELTIPSGTIGTTTYYNVGVTVGSLVSIDGVAGADSYDGSHLTISSVQVGGKVYHNAVITVGRIISVAGGMPAGAQDIYNPANRQLAIPAVQVGSHVYTNVTITVGTVESSGESP